MTQTIEEKLESAKKLAQEAEKKRIQLETKLEATQAKKKDLLDKCKTLGVKPTELESKIAELELTIEKGMQELETILPADESEELPY